MNIVLVSTFWNAQKFIPEYINSLKNQRYTNFTSYLIDDMSTDNSLEIARDMVGDDERFILIKNDRKKFKTENFVETIRNNSDIDDWDVIIELDGDDMLSDEFVLGRINQIYQDPNVWIAGFKWIDQNGKSMKYGKANADSPRTSTWNFSHMRTYRAFLFRNIRDEDLRMNGEYFKAAVDLGMGMPMLEMAGNEHYRFFDEVTYIYHWHDHQSYSDKSAMGNKKIQGDTAKYIYSSLPRYKKLDLPYMKLDYEIYRSSYSPYSEKKQLSIEVLEAITKMTLKKQTIKPVIKQNLQPKPNEPIYVVEDNTNVLNDVLKLSTRVSVTNVKPTNPPISPKPLNNNVVTQPIKTNQQKKVITEKRNDLISFQKRIIPDGFEGKKRRKI